MTVAILTAAEARWRAQQLGLLRAGAGALSHSDRGDGRHWHLAPGHASERYVRHDASELFVLLHGSGRLRAGADLLELEAFSAVLVAPGTVRQVFNDTCAEQLWLVVGGRPAPDAAHQRGARASRLIVGGFDYASAPTAVTWVDCEPLSRHVLRGDGDHEQVYAVLDGRGRMRVGAEECAVRRGNLVFVAPGTEHVLSVSERPLRYVHATRPCQSAPTASDARRQAGARLSQSLVGAG